MTALPADENLAPAREQLATAIHNLIDPRRVTLPTGRHTWLDSVYQELADAVYERHGTGQGGTEPGGGLWLDASECLTAIDRLAQAEHPQHPGYAPQDRRERRLTAPTVLRLQAVDDRRWRPQDAPHIREVATNLERLTLRAENLLSPPTVWYLPNACPLCGADHVYVADAGDQVRRPALQITTDYCRCGAPNCDGYWPASRFQFLGALLGYRKPVGVIE